MFKEYKNNIDKLIEKQHNGYITFEDCVKECNEIVNNFKYALFYINNNEYSSNVVWDIVTQLRMYMLNQLMGLLINTDINIED